MSQDQTEILQRALKREKAARKAAESILEEKSRELFFTTQRLEILLDEKSSQLQGVFENIIDAYVVMDIGGNVIKFNEAATKLFGYDIEKEKVNVTNLVYKDDYEYAINSFMELTSKGFFKDYEARVYTKSKEVKWVHINASIIFDKDKKPVAAQGIVRDISDQKSRSSQEIKDVQARLEDTIRSLNIKMEVKSSHLNFSVDEISDRVMVTVTNKNTGEVVRQVPADAILKVAHNMEALKGVIFDEMF